MVANLTNLTSGTQGLYHFADYSNNVSGGIFWGLILIAIFFIIAIKLRKLGIDRSVAVASFSCLSISLFFLYLQFVQIGFPIVFVLILAGTLAYIKFSGE